MFTAPVEPDDEVPAPDPAVLGSQRTPPDAEPPEPPVDPGSEAVPDEPGVGLEQVRMVPLVKSAPAPMSGVPMPPALKDSGPTPASMARGSSASITGRSRWGEEVRRFANRMATSSGLLVGTGSPNPHEITVKKVFLGGHSQGGYLVTRLNTMHQTNGVIANAPGPLNLVYRCQLEENGQIASGVTCDKLRNTYGTTNVNPGAYFQRSLLNFTNGFKSDILFVQGLNDSPIQLYTWPTFKQEVLNCTNCQGTQFVEVPGGTHPSLFTSPVAKTEFNNFINSR